MKLSGRVNTKIGTPLLKLKKCGIVAAQIPERDQLRGKQNSPSNSVRFIVDFKLKH